MKKNEVNTLLNKLKNIEDQLIKLNKMNESQVNNYSKLNDKVKQLEENESNNINEIFKFCCCI